MRGPIAGAPPLSLLGRADPALTDSHRKTLRMVKNERTAGAIPHWEKPAAPQDISLQRLTRAATGTAWQADQPPLALAYQAPADAPPPDDSFGFADLIDMINPLQHIPLLNLAYREITGDQIKPIGKIIGGAVFGGAAGAAGGMVNVALEHETGKDIAGHTLALLRDTDGEEIRQAKNPDQPEYRLTMVEQRLGVQDLPGTVIAFADLSQPPPRISTERIDPRKSLLFRESV